MLSLVDRDSSPECRSAGEFSPSDDRSKRRPVMWRCARIASSLFSSEYSTHRSHHLDSTRKAYPESQRMQESSTGSTCSKYFRLITCKFILIHGSSEILSAGGFDNIPVTLEPLVIL